jgi:hypothetical protein
VTLQSAQGRGLGLPSDGRLITGLSANARSASELVRQMMLQLGPTQRRSRSIFDEPTQIEDERLSTPNVNCILRIALALVTERSPTRSILQKAREVAPKEVLALHAYVPEN